jgi:hypothetical protein
MQTVLNQKPSCLLKGGLAFLFGESVLISVRYLKLCDLFDTGKKYLDFECTIFLSFHLHIQSLAEFVILLYITGFERRGFFHTNI